MASSDDDLRINTLHRFAKHSPRLTLQEYSHCEVPAGCGGVVLRWTDPGLGPLAWINIATPGTADTFLDGVPLASSRAPLSPGRHVLAFHLRGLELAPAPVAISVGPDRHDWQMTNRLLDAHPRIERWAAGPRAGDPAAPDYDDGDWNITTHADAAFGATLPARFQRWFQRVFEGGMTVLVLGRANDRFDEAWIRIRFALDARFLVVGEEDR